MKKRFFTAACLLALLILVALFQPRGTRATTDAYFDSFYTCDAGYYPNLQTCRGTPGYPYDPDESDCRYGAAQSWQSCISAAYGQMTPEEPDFCAAARQARDHCHGQYGPDGADPDMMAHMVCVNNSGISYCE